MLGRPEEDAVAELGTRIISILEPYIGDTAADTCVRAAAEQVSKPVEALSAEDVPAIEECVRQLLTLVAPPTTVDGIIDDIKQAAQ
jgi:hypothetical protein